MAAEEYNAFFYTLVSTVSIRKRTPYVRQHTATCVVYPQGAQNLAVSIAHFTVACLVTWPLIGSEAGRDLVLIQTSLFFICN